MNEKGIITPKRDFQSKVVPAFFSFFALLLIVTGSISVISLQNQLKTTQNLQNKAVGEERATVADGCVVTGCSSQLCLDPEQAANLDVTECRMQPAYACYHTATCRIQTDGHCGWTQTEELQACINGTSATPTPSPIIIVLPTPTPSASPSYQIVDLQAGKPASLTFREVLAGAAPFIEAVFDAQPTFLYKFGNETGYARGYLVNVPAGKNMEFVAKEIDDTNPGYIKNVVYDEQGHIFGSYSGNSYTGNTVRLFSADAPTKYFIVLRTDGSSTGRVEIQYNEVAAQLPGDFNNDGKINLIDYTILTNEFLQTGTLLKADMNNDQKVDLADYTLFIQKLNP